MKFRLLAAAFALLATPALAQTPGSYVLRDNAGVTFNVGVFQCPTGKMCPLSVSSDSSGNPLSGPIGNSNANDAALYVQGVTGGVPIPVAVTGTAQVAIAGNSSANPLYIAPATGASFNVVCTAGCSGGGGGGGGVIVPFGTAIGANGSPSGFKDAAGNFQALLGDTTAGQWVNLKASVPLTIAGPIATTQSGTWNVGTVATLPAITGTVTANAGTNLNTSALALESGGNLAAAAGSLSSVDGKTPALGQALAAASVPVVLPASQISTLTPPSTVAVTQATAGSLNATVVGTGTFAVQAAQTGTWAIDATLAAETGKVIGTVRNLGGSGATLDFAGQNAVSPANAWLIGGQYNASPTTLVSGRASPLQLDSDGNLKVNIASGGASGVAQGSATPGQIGGLVQGAATTAAPTYADGTTNPLSLDAAGNLRTVFTNSTLAVTQSGTWNIGTISGAISLPTGAATAAAQTSGSQKTQIVDGSGNVIAATANALNVQCANCSGTGASGTDGGTFTAGSSVFAPGGGIYQTTATANPLANGQWGAWQMTANRAGFVNLRNASGGEIGTAGTPLQVSLGNTGANATALKVDGSAVTQPISGTVAATQSGAWNVTNISGTVSLPTGAATAANQTANQTPVAPAAATATKGALLAMQYNATQATFTNGQQGAVQGTARGALYVATGADPFTVRNTGAGGATIDFAGQNAAAPANAWLIGGQYNSSPTTVASGNASPLQIDSAGNLKVNIAAGASSGAVAQGSTTGGQTGGLMQAAVTAAAPSYSTGTTNPLSMDSAGNLRVAVATATGLAQGSTTSGQTGSMIMGAVTTSAPTYTNAQTSPVTLTIGGAVRTDLTTLGGSSISTGNGTAGAGSQRVTVASDSPARAVGGEGATGAAVPSGAVLAGAQSGANMVALIQASASVKIDVSTATTAQLVALSGSTKIYVTSWDVVSGGNGNVKLVYGTGTNCATGKTDLTGNYPLTAQAGLAKGSGLGPVLIVPAGNALCVMTSAAVQMSGSLSYTQF